MSRTDCCGRQWLVGDPCGIVCAFITWMLVLYGEFVVCSVMLWSWDISPWHQSIQAVLFNILAILALASHLKTMLTDPGAVPKGNATEEYIERIQSMMGNKVVYKCQKCCSVKPERAHHCSVCQRCIRRMDHHCPWVNNCVGEGNQKFFVLFTMYIALLSLQSLYWGIWQFVHCVGTEWQNCSAFGPPATTMLLIFLLFEAILFSIFTCVMFGTQISSIVNDETAIESLRREEGRAKGEGWKNLQAVFGGPASWKWASPFVQPYAGKHAIEYCV